MRSAAAPCMRGWELFSHYFSRSDSNFQPQASSLVVPHLFVRRLVMTHEAKQLLRLEG